MSFLDTPEKQAFVNGLRRWGNGVATYWHPRVGQWFAYSDADWNLTQLDLKELFAGLRTWPPFMWSLAPPTPTADDKTLKAAYDDIESHAGKIQAQSPKANVVWSPINRNFWNAVRKPPTKDTCQQQFRQAMDACATDFSNRLIDVAEYEECVARARVARDLCIRNQSS